MTVELKNFANFSRDSAALHQIGLTKFGKPYKQHTHRVLTSVFFSLIKRLSITSSIEVGAFKAEFSRRFQLLGKDRVTLAVEANPYNFAAFQAEIEALGIIYHHAAVVASDGPCTLQLSNTEQDIETGFIRGNNSVRTAASRTETRPVSVPGTSLDSLIDYYVQSHAYPDPAILAPALWIDAEGALDMVISGGNHTIRNSVALFTEVESTALWDDQSDFESIVERLRELGFFPFLRDCEYEPDQFNVIFVNKHLINRSHLTELEAEFESALQNISEPL